MLSTNIAGNILLIVDILMAALIAGVFFAWSTSVMPGLSRLPDQQYLAALQAMNRAIVNPVFMLCFLSPLILLPLCTWLMRGTSMLPFLVVASALYWLGVFGVTMAGNVPLNEQLDRLDLTSNSDTGTLKMLRRQFESWWVMLNNVRLLVSITVVLVITYACITGPGPRPVLNQQTTPGK